MRAAHNEVSLVQGFHGARMEAEKAFGNAEVYIEKLIVNPHHIEFQIMADNYGNTVHLGERDCSIQRRNQKVIEECPSPLLTPALRKRMGQAAVKLAQSVGYVNAGTMEFLVDQKGDYYFIEMNTRIQVEHTITEEVYGCDLVKEQIHIAAGDRLSPHVARPLARSHAIQCRINAEDPARNFQPSAGRINFYYAPGGRGVRIDSHAYTGYTVPPHYDSMIAKLIAVGATRESAIARMRRALGRISHHRDQDDDSVSQRDHAQRRLSQRPLRHRLRRPDDELRNVRAAAIERPVDRLSGSAVNGLTRRRLYAILDLGYVEPARAEAVVGELIRGGADLIQLRGKKQSLAELTCLAEKLHRLTSAAGVPLIINDHPEIARDVALEGLHLGQDDVAIGRRAPNRETRLLDREIDPHPGPGDCRGGGRRRLHRLWPALCHSDQARISADRDRRHSARS